MKFNLIKGFDFLAAGFAGTSDRVCRDIGQGLPGHRTGFAGTFFDFFWALYLIPYKALVRVAGKV